MNHYPVGVGSYATPVGGGCGCGQRSVGDTVDQPNQSRWDTKMTLGVAIVVGFVVLAFFVAKSAYDNDVIKEKYDDDPF
jgi:hypothetical protein